MADITDLSLGQNVKYTDDDSNELLATIQAKTADGKLIISLAGGTTLTVNASDVDDTLKFD